MRDIGLMLVFLSMATTAWAGDAAKGEAIFKSKCQTCHGVQGDAGNKGGLKTAANFANLDANIPRIKKLLAGLSEADHLKIVRDGGAKSGVAGAGAAMPKLGLREAEIADVVAYERTLPAFSKTSPKEDKQSKGKPAAEAAKKK